MSTLQNTTQRIRLLAPGVAEKIAAGEVIERPASVVKELVENSLDAGATEIAVILENGGKSLIEILDNGYGMGPADLSLSIARHATSKLRALGDLEKLRTLGFRGEALASVAAVADLSLLSREENAQSAHELTLRDGMPPTGPEALTFGHFLGSPHGTRIRVQGLFAQMPARLKFLKSQAAEVSQVREWIERLALAHPKISFRLVTDDRTILNLRSQEETARVKTILSDGEDFPVVTASNEMDPGAAVRVRVHWIQGLSNPQTRRLVQVVNGRAVRDRMLQQAVLTPFRQALLPGRFPAVALFIDVDPSLIDVNVHPTKTEIRFLEAQKVFRAVESLVDSMIAKYGAPAFAAAPLGLTAGLAVSAEAASIAQSAGQAPVIPWQVSEPRIPTTQKFWDFTSTPVFPSALSSNDSPVPLTGSFEHGFDFNRYVGIIFNTYLIYDFGQELGLIDQHAAHERVRYEKLRKRVLSEGATPSPQALLLPEAVHFSAEHRIDLEERLPWLAKFGFEAELFGDESVLFRAVPSEWGTDSLQPRLKNLVGRILAYDGQGGSDVSGAPSSNVLIDESLFETLASEACHSAIRAGDRLEAPEVFALVDQLFECEHPWNCPHGRPTVLRIPRARFEEWFLRKV